jgi:hypothetical protein
MEAEAKSVLFRSAENKTHRLQRECSKLGKKDESSVNLSTPFNGELQSVVSPPISPPSALAEAACLPLCSPK